jgi:hypothetical protein
MRIYVHGPGSSEVVVLDEAPTDRRLSDLVEILDGDYVFLDDEDEPVDIQLSLVAIVRTDEPTHHHHLHHHPCRQITVVVFYNGMNKEVPASAGTRVESVLLRAISLFGIDPVTGADLVLRRQGTEADLPPSTHIGSLVPRGSCTISLNLLPGHREQG